MPPLGVLKVWFMYPTQVSNEQVLNHYTFKTPIRVTSKEAYDNYW